jgi:hypothetical protein
MEIPQSIQAELTKNPHFLTFPMAWLIQREVGGELDHHVDCSSIKGNNPLSGPHFLCDCGAVTGYWADIGGEDDS